MHPQSYISALKKSCRQWTARIFTSDYADGNGVVVGDLLITAAHVIEDSKSFDVWFGDYHYCLDTSSAVFFQPPTIKSEDGRFLDLAVYRLNDIHSPVKFFEGNPEKSDIICLAWHHGVDKTSNRELWTSFDTDVMFIGKKGNFIECMMSEPVVKGYSGCPLFANGELVGILYGSGDEGRTCYFLSCEAIRNVIEKI